MLEGVFGFQLRGQVPPLPATGLCPVFTAERELTPESFTVYPVVCTAQGIWTFLHPDAKYKSS